MHDAKLNLTLPRELLDKVKEEADSNYISVSAMVRIILSGYTAEKERK